MRHLHISHVDSKAELSFISTFSCQEHERLILTLRLNIKQQDNIQLYWSCQTSSLTFLEWQFRAKGFLLLILHWRAFPHSSKFQSLSISALISKRQNNLTFYTEIRDMLNSLVLLMVKFYCKVKCLWAPCITVLDWVNTTFIWRLKSCFFSVKEELDKLLSLLQASRVKPSHAHLLFAKEHFFFARRFVSYKKNPHILPVYFS